MSDQKKQSSYENKVINHKQPTQQNKDPEVIVDIHRNIRSNVNTNDKEINYSED